MNDPLDVKVEPTSFEFIEPGFPWESAAWVWGACISLGVILGVAFVVLTGH